MLMEPPFVDFAQIPSPVSPWAEAGHDAAAFGAALDRVFGEASDLHVRRAFRVGRPAVPDDRRSAGAAGQPDGRARPADGRRAAAPMPELAAVYDFAPDGLHLQDLWVTTLTPDHEHFTTVVLPRCQAFRSPESRAP